MVNKNIYAVRDEKVGFNSSLMLCENEAVAIRDFANFVKTPGTIINQNPEDFSLWQVGIFSVENGTIDGTSNVCICKAVDFVSMNGEVKNV